MKSSPLDINNHYRQVIHTPLAQHPTIFLHLVTHSIHNHSMTYAGECNLVPFPTTPLYLEHMFCEFFTLNETPGYCDHISTTMTAFQQLSKRLEKLTQLGESI